MTKRKIEYSPISATPDQLRVSLVSANDPAFPDPRSITSQRETDKGEYDLWGLPAWAGHSAGRLKYNCRKEVTARGRRGLYMKHIKYSPVSELRALLMCITYFPFVPNFFL